MVHGPIEIPNKSTFKINEVCALTGVKSYVLRFWESEFPEISPITSSSGVKLYEHRDIEAILLIKKLLFEDKLSVEKAKALIKTSFPPIDLVEKEFDQSSAEYSSVDGYSPRLQNTKRVLDEGDFHKLVLAKNKLSKILKELDSIQKRKNW
jgi:DNA-binding transcriptional MerR regulator